MRISDRISSLAASATLALNAKVQSLRQEGVDIVDFGAGQPDFPTPDAVKRAAIAAIEANKTRYTAASGLPEARAAVAHHLREEFQLEYDPAKEVLVTNGAKQALFNAVHATADSGDEVILFSPYWVSYPEQVRSSGATPVVVPTEDNGFRIDPDRLRAAITDRTRTILLNSPSNPSGAVLPREDLEAIARIAIEHDLVVVTDEIYAKMVYDGSFVPFTSLSDEIRARSIVVGAVSKTYSMTGWRFGWATGPAELIGPMARLQAHSTSNACSITQWAAIEALTGDQSETEARAVEFAKRRDRMLERIRAIDGIECAEPGGAFFAFPRVDRFYGGRIDGRKIDGSLAFAEACLDVARIALVPGLPFGSDAFVRISYATSIEEIDRGMDRFEELVAKIEQPA